MMDSKHTTEPVAYQVIAYERTQKLFVSAEIADEYASKLRNDWDTEVEVRPLYATPTAPSEDVRDAQEDLLRVLAEHPRWQLDCEVQKFGVPGKWRVWSLKGNREYSAKVRVHGEGATPAEALRAAMLSTPKD